VRVPLAILPPPDVLAKPVRVRRTASHIDLLPTLLDLLGEEPRPELPGRSLLEPGARPALFFTDYSLAWLGIRDGRWKLVHELRSERSELYDLAVDPGETRNLAADHAARTRRYVEALRAWCAGVRGE